MKLPLQIGKSGNIRPKHLTPVTQKHYTLNSKRRSASQTIRRFSLMFHDTLILLNLPFVPSCCPKLYKVLFWPWLSQLGGADMTDQTFSELHLCVRDWLQKSWSCSCCFSSLAPSFSKREAQELPTPPGSCQASSAVENLIFFFSREVSWWNKFNQLFLFSFGRTHAIIASFFQSVNSLWTHYFLRVSLKLWQLILRPSKAKTVFFVLFFPPETWPVCCWVLRFMNIG